MVYAFGLLRLWRTYTNLFKEFSCHVPESLKSTDSINLQNELMLLAGFSFKFSLGTLGSKFLIVLR